MGRGRNIRAPCSTNRNHATSHVEHSFFTTLLPLSCDISLSNQPCSCEPNKLSLWCSSIANPSHPTCPSYIYIHFFSSPSLQSIPKVISLLRQYIIYSHMKISICAAALVACLVVLPVLVPARPVARTHPRMFCSLIISLLCFALKAFNILTYIANSY